MKRRSVNPPSSKGLFFNKTVWLRPQCESVFTETYTKAFGGKGKGIWFQESLDIFLQDPNCLEFAVTESMSPFNSSMAVKTGLRMGSDTLKKLEGLETDIRKTYPEVSVSQESVIRQVILYRLIRECGLERVLGDITQKTD